MVGTGSIGVAERSGRSESALTRAGGPDAREAHAEALTAEKSTAGFIANLNGWWLARS